MYHLIVKPTHAHFQFLFIKIYLKFLKILLHVSVIRPSSGSFQFLAKITLIKNTFDIPILKLAMWQHVVLCVLNFTWRVPDTPDDGRMTETCRSILRNFK